MGSVRVNGVSLIEGASRNPQHKPTAFSDDNCRFWVEGAAIPSDQIARRQIAECGLAPSDSVCPAAASDGAKFPALGGGQGVPRAPSTINTKFNVSILLIELNGQIGAPLLNQESAHRVFAAHLLSFQSGENITHHPVPHTVPTGTGNPRAARRIPRQMQRPGAVFPVFREGALYW